MERVDLLDQAETRQNAEGNVAEFEFYYSTIKIWPCDQD